MYFRGPLVIGLVKSDIQLEKDEDDEDEEDYNDEDEE
jgi:hypothetical protein